MKITFLLPGASPAPSGGYKIVYEYANRLVHRGHFVSVVCPYFVPSIDFGSLPAIKKAYRYLHYKVHHKKKVPCSWFTINQGVHYLIPPTMNQILIPNADIVVATAWDTAESIANYNHHKGEKLYFIQGLDTVFNHTNQERIMNTWKLPMKKIVVSRWLEGIAQDMGEQAKYIPNGIDFSMFYLDIPIESRNPQTICLINNELEFKGTADGLEALHLVKQKAPAIAGLMFGLPPRPQTLPDWITYYQNPTQKGIRSIYNASAIFIGTSWCEGFGLPVCEAAACGAALCVTDNGGHREMAINEETALLHQPKHPEQITQNILRLLENNDRRIELARKANTFVKKFSWDKSVEELEQTFIKALADKVG